MPTISFSDKDIKMGKVVDPAWYRVRIDDVGEKPSADGGSTNYPMDATVICNGDTGSQEFAGVPIRWNFNSKAIGLARGFIEIVADSVVEAGKNYELAGAKNAVLDVYVDNKIYEGRMLNNVPHKYRKPKPDVNPV